MAKKEHKEEIVFSPADDIGVEEEKSMFETEAYGTPKPEAGSDVTVMKQVGVGGPVPIVAPKHNTIQLQPIIVPLAVVPYMTQDSNVLRTDGKQQASSDGEEYGEATKFENVSEVKKVKNKQAKVSRLVALITLIVSLVIETPFILANYGRTLGGESLDDFNIIFFIKIWLQAVQEPFNPTYATLMICVFVLMGLVAIMSLIVVVIGKYPRAFFGIMSFGSLGLLLAIMTMRIMNGEFNPSGEKIFILLIALTAFVWVLSIVAAIVLSKIEDKKEKVAASEI